MEQIPADDLSGRALGQDVWSASLGKEGPIKWELYHDAGWANPNREPHLMEVDLPRTWTGHQGLRLATRLSHPWCSPSHTPLVRGTSRVDVTSPRATRPKRRRLDLLVERNASLPVCRQRGWPTSAAGPRFELDGTESLWAAIHPCCTSSAFCDITAGISSGLIPRADRDAGFGDRTT